MRDVVTPPFHAPFPQATVIPSTGGAGGGAYRESFLYLLYEVCGDGGDTDKSRTTNL